MNREDKEARLEELRDLQDDLRNQADELESEIEDLEYDIEQESSDWDYVYPDDLLEEDNRQRAADMNATLRDIGGGL